MGNNKRFEEILDDLRAQYDGRLLLTVREMGEVLGIKPQTIYNRISRTSKKPFPIKVVRMGGPKFSLYDVVQFIVE